jgi:hypothetical protein
MIKIAGIRTVHLAWRTLGLGLLLVAASSLPSWAQTSSTAPLTVSLGFTNGTTRYLLTPEPAGSDPLEVTLTVVNTSGGPVVATKGLLENLHLHLSFLGPKGEQVTALHLLASAVGKNPPIRIVDGEYVAVDPVETLASDFSRTVTFDAREFYAFTKAGFYTVQAFIPFRSYPTVNFTSESGATFAFLNSATLQGVLASNTLSLTLVADADGDGYCVPEADPRLCANPQPDCDDTNLAINPGATEIPNNGVDDDCNPATVDDPTAPTTTATVAPPPNANGWNQTEVTVTLSATDAGSGIKSLEYTLAGAASGAQVVGGAATTIPISPEGATTVSFFATDQAGNQETPPKTKLVRVDKTAPTLTVPANFSVNATGPSGAVVTYTVTATDNLTPSPSVSCTKASGSAFPIGTTTVTCTATDLAGNSTSKSFTVTVKGALEQVDDLIAKVQSLPIDTKTKNSFLSQLTAAKDLITKNNITGACGKLKDFIRSVSSQSGKKLTKQQADDLIADAERIRAVLGCS